MDLTLSLLYSFLPAVVGALLGAVILWPALKPGLAMPTHRGLALVLVSLLAIPVVFGFVAAQLASLSDGDFSFPLTVVGFAALATCVAQGFVVRQGFAAVLADPQAFGRLLVRTWALEVFGVLGLVYFILTWASAPAA